jgi:hypothetical protein
VGKLPQPDRWSPCHAGILIFGSVFPAKTRLKRAQHSAKLFWFECERDISYLIIGVAVREIGNQAGADSTYPENAPAVMPSTSQ